MNKEKLGTGRDENRIPLYQVVPLKVPFSIGIGISDFCNFKCVYCTHSIPSFKARKEKMLSWEEFINIIDNINELCKTNGNVKIKNFSICGLGEPLTCNKLPEMVEYIRKQDFAERIEITTNGSLLTHSLSDELVAAGLTRLLISVQGVNAEAYKRICGYNIDFEKFIAEIEYFYQNRKQCKVYIKTLDAALKENEKALFYNIFTPIADMVNIEHMEKVFEDVDYTGIMSNDKNKKTRYGYEWHDRKCCDSLFMRMNINTNGRVDACGCQQPALSIGNLLKKPLSQIWNGELHRKYMEMHLSGIRHKIPRCAHCDIMALGGHPMDNLDEHMDEILERLKML